jgi:WD40 repeat protein
VAFFLTAIGRSIWDLGKLVHLPEDAEGEQFDDCIVTTVEHSNAVSSAYFDPSGTKILSTSYDDKLRGEQTFIG